MSPVRLLMLWHMRNGPQLIIKFCLEVWDLLSVCAVTISHPSIRPESVSKQVYMVKKYMPYRDVRCIKLRVSFDDIWFLLNISKLPLAQMGINRSGPFDLHEQLKILP